MIIRILAGLSLWCLSLTVQAGTYGQLVPEDSKIQFEYQQMGVAMEGGFASLEGDISFDSEQPEQATVVIELAMQDVDTGYDEANDEAARPEWFDSARFPLARFESERIAALKDGQYDVSGTLTIKGRTVPVQFPARFTTDGDKGIFEGSLKIKRGDFAIGEGTWAQFDVVANDVSITFHIVARP